MSNDIERIKKLAGIESESAPQPLNESEINEWNDKIYTHMNPKTPASKSEIADLILKHSKLKDVGISKGASEPKKAFPGSTNPFLKDIQDEPSNKGTMHRRLTDDVGMCCPQCQCAEIECDTGFCPECQDFFDPIPMSEDLNSELDAQEDQFGTSIRDTDPNANVIDGTVDNDYTTVMQLNDEEMCESDDEGEDLKIDIDDIKKPVGRPEVDEFGDEFEGDAGETVIDLGDDSDDFPEQDIEIEEPSYSSGSMDPHRMIAKIQAMQDSGMSSASAYYDIDRLMDMPTDRIQNIYRKVMGESVNEAEEDEGEDLKIDIEDLKKPVGRPEVDEFGDEFEGDAGDSLVDVEDGGDYEDVSFDIEEPSFKSTSIDVSRLIAEIEQMQDSGMSSSNINYPIDRLESLPAEKVANIHRKVMGLPVQEEVAGTLDNGYDEQFMSAESGYKGGFAFPTGQANNAVDKVKYTGKYGDNAIDEETYESIHESIKSAFSKFCESYEAEIEEAAPSTVIKAGKFEKERAERRAEREKANGASEKPADYKKKVSEMCVDEATSVVELIVQGNYGQGWEDVHAEDVDKYDLAKSVLKDYRDNDRSGTFRLIRRRSKK